jgi:hypothetical protein
MNSIEQCKERIRFILEQIESLEHYLPATYQMLMDELDHQNMTLKNYELETFYRSQSHEHDDATTASADQVQTQESTYQQT